MADVRRPQARCRPLEAEPRTCSDRRVKTLAAVLMLALASVSALVLWDPGGGSAGLAALEVHAAGPGAPPGGALREGGAGPGSSGEPPAEQGGGAPPPGGRGPSGAEEELADWTIPGAPAGWAGRRSALEEPVAAAEEVDGAEPSGASPRPREERRSTSWWEELRAMPLEELIADLRDDDVKWNATRAVGELWRRLDEDAAERGRLAERLAPQLASADPQQRTLCTGLLLRLGTRCREEGEPFAPSPALLDAAERWLSGRPALDSRFFLIGERPVVRFGLAFTDELESRLVARLRRPEGREVFLHAYLLGASGKRAHADLAAPRLLPRLRHNGVSDDACLAQQALAGLGPDVLPHLDAALPEADEQQRVGLEAVRFQVIAPCLDADDAATRAHLNTVTWKVAFPPAEYRYDLVW